MCSPEQLRVKHMDVTGCIARDLLSGRRWNLSMVVRHRWGSNRKGPMMNALICRLTPCQLMSLPIQYDRLHPGPPL